MKIVMLNEGSAGDMHPLFGVARALAQRGHRIVICTNDVYRAPIERLGLGFASTGTVAQYDAGLANPDLWRSTRARITAWRTGVVPRRRMMFDTVMKQLDADTVLVCGMIGAGVGGAIREKFGVPLVTAALAPSTFLSARLPPRGAGLPCWAPFPLRAIALRGLDRLIDRVIGPDLNRFRRDLGLPPLSNIRCRTIFSPNGTLALFPSWFAPPQPDWPAPVTLTGFPLFEEQEQDLDPMLQAFLARGSAPVVFTAGTGMRHAHAFFSAACALLLRTGLRGILLSKSAQQIPADLPPDILYRQYVPLAKLLPRCRALVHHGGIGTTAQALAAGIPQLIVPFAFDQFDNAARVSRLGCGITVKAVADDARSARVLQTLVDSPDLRQACLDLKARGEPGEVAARRAAMWIEQAGNDHAADLNLPN